MKTTLDSGSERQPLGGSQTTDSASTNTHGGASASPRSKGALVVPRREPFRGAEALRRIAQNKLMVAGLIIVLLFVTQALLPDLIAPCDPIAIDVPNAYEGPSRQHLLGTDDLGRDVLSRVIHGSRVSLAVSFTAVAISVVIGNALGLIAGYFGDPLDQLICRIMDLLFAFPSLLLAIAIAGVLGPSVTNAVIAMIVVYSPLFSRVIRGSVLMERHREYITAAEMIGAGHGRIMVRHVLPNVAPSVMVQASLRFSTAILTEAALSFLGLGVQPPTPSWGRMLSEGRRFMEIAPWVSIFPGIAIMLTVLAFNLVGDGVRDVLDPRLRQR